jgi:hypothetical protein
MLKQPKLDIVERKKTQAFAWVFSIMQQGLQNTFLKKEEAILGELISRSVCSGD